MSLDTRAAMVELANVLEATAEAADFRGRWSDGGGPRDPRLLPPVVAEQSAALRPLGLTSRTISKMLVSIFCRRVAHLRSWGTRGRSGRSRRYDMTARSER